MSPRPPVELREVTKRYRVEGRTQFTPPVPLLSRLSGRVTEGGDVPDEDDDDEAFDDEEEDFGFVAAPKGARPLALDAVSLKVRRGTQVGVLGRAGSGKTTLLRLVTGLSVPTSGRVVVRGSTTPIADFAVAVARKDGNPEYNLQLLARTGGLSRREARRRTDEILRFAGIGHIPLGAEVPLGLLRPLVFAAALHLTTDVVVLDDLTLLDPAFRERCVDRLLELRGSEQTVLLASADRQLIERVCTHACWLDDGAVRARGEAPDVVEQVRATMSEELRRQLEDQELTPETHVPAPERSFNRWAAVTGARLVSPNPLEVEVELEVADQPVTLAVMVGFAGAGDAVVAFRQPALQAYDTPGRYRVRMRADDAEVPPGSYAARVVALVGQGPAITGAIGRQDAFEAEIVGSGLPEHPPEATEVVHLDDGSTWQVYPAEWAVSGPL